MFFITKRTFILTASLLLIGVGIIHAINTTMDGWRLPASQTQDVILADGSCRRVTNNNTTPYDRFLPTRSMSEWNSFESNTPIGVIIGNCEAIWRKYVGNNGVYYEFTEGSSSYAGFGPFICSGCIPSTSYKYQYNTSSPTPMYNAPGVLSWIVTTGNDAGGDYIKYTYFANSSWYTKWYRDHVYFINPMLYVGGTMPACTQPPPLVNNIAYRHVSGYMSATIWYYRCIPGDKWEYCSTKYYSYNVLPAETNCTLM